MPTEENSRLQHTLYYHHVRTTPAWYTAKVQNSDYTIRRPRDLFRSNDDFLSLRAVSPHPTHIPLGVIRFQFKGVIFFVCLTRDPVLHTHVYESECVRDLFYHLHVLPPGSSRGWLMTVNSRHTFASLVSIHVSCHRWELSQKLNFSL